MTSQGPTPPPAALAAKNPEGGSRSDECSDAPVSRRRQMQRPSSAPDLPVRHGNLQPQTGRFGGTL
jgi:hypothetical protein